MFLYFYIEMYTYVSPVNLPGKLLPIKKFTRHFANFFLPKKLLCSPNQMQSKTHNLN